MLIIGWKRGYEIARERGPRKLRAGQCGWHGDGGCLQWLDLLILIGRAPFTLGTLHSASFFVALFSLILCFSLGYLRFLLLFSWFTQFVTARTII